MDSMPENLPEICQWTERPEATDPCGVGLFVPLMGRTGDTSALLPPALWPKAMDGFRPGTATHG